MAKWTGARPQQEDEADLGPYLVEDGQLVLPPELQAPTDAFLVAATQWRWASTGMAHAFGVMMLTPIRVGMDYVGAAKAWEMAGIASSPALFDDLRLMEAAALVALGEASDDG